MKIWRVSCTIENIYSLWLLFFLILWCLTCRRIDFKCCWIHQSFFPFYVISPGPRQTFSIWNPHEDWFIFTSALMVLYFTFCPVFNYNLFWSWALYRFSTIRQIYITYWTPLSFLTDFWNCHIQAHNSNIHKSSSGQSILLHMSMPIYWFLCQDPTVYM